MSNGQLLGGFPPPPPQPYHPPPHVPPPPFAQRPQQQQQAAPPPPQQELTQTATIRNAVNLKKPTLEVGDCAALLLPAVR